MKIAIIVRVLWPGGVQRIAFAEAEGLINAGYDVDLIFIRGTGRFQYPTNIPIKILYGPNVKKRFLGKIFGWITLHYIPQRGSDATVDMDLIWKTEHTLKNKYDVMYYFDEFSAFFAKNSKKKYGNKVVVIIHEVALNKGSLLSKWIQKRTLKSADLVLTNTKYNLDLLKKYGYNNAYELYPGLTVNPNVLPFSQRENLIISVTMWDYGRKPEVFLRIADNLNKGKILLCGNWADYGYMKSFENKIKNLGLEDKIGITGQIEENVLQSYYRKAKVAIRFGYNEHGPGMGSLEAISSGIPMIINNGIGAREVIEDGKCGFIVNEERSEDIVPIIDELLTNEETWTRISNACHQKSYALSWNEHNKKLSDLIGHLNK